MHRFLLILILMGSLLAGCDDFNQHGGKGRLIFDDQVVVRQADGSTTTTTYHSEVDIGSAESPNKPAIVEYNKDEHKVIVKLDTGTSRNDTAILASINLLKIPMYAGLVLIVIGVLVGIIFKNMKWAVAIGATGVGIAVGSYLLAQYAVYFLLGFGIIFAYGFYLLWDYMRRKKANIENVELIERAKSRGIIKIDEFHDLARALQSDSTKQIVEIAKDKLDVADKAEDKKDRESKS